MQQAGSVGVTEDPGYQIQVGEIWNNSAWIPSCEFELSTILYVIHVILRLLNSLCSMNSLCSQETD